MISALATGLIIGCLVVAAWTLGLVILNKPVNDPTLGLLALLELALLVQAVIGIVNLTRTDRDVSGVTFVGYLVGSLLETAKMSKLLRSVLIVACLVIPVMIVRMNQVWNG